MKIIDFEIFSYALPLTRPLFADGKELRSREGFLLFLQGEDHSIGIGEVAPLPGFCTERLQDAEKQLFFLRNKVLFNKIPDGVELLTWHFETWLPPLKLFPSVRSGFEMAVLDLLARSRNISLRYLLNQESASCVPFAGLLTQDSRKRLQREISPMLRLGIRSFKLKVGNQDITTDLEKVSWACEMIGNARLHLDANRQWRYGQAFNFIKELDSHRIEYFEEPINETERLGEFSRATHFPLALDETLREMPPDVIEKIETLRVLILKPMLLGGWEKAMGLARFAKERGIRVAISSSFESAVELKALSHLACALTPEEPAGLDTGKWFEKDLFIKPFEIKEGMIIPNPVDLEKKDINFKLLRAVKDV